MKDTFNYVHWRQFARLLTELLGQEGHSSFFEDVLFFLNEFVVVDSCAVFKISIDKSSGAEHICTFGKLPKDIAEKLALDYTQYGFKADPMVQTALLSSKARVRKLPESHYSQSYRSQFFESSSLIDKITSVHTRHNTMFVVSFYRLENSGYFKVHDFKDLQILAPIISQSVLRHVNLQFSKSQTKHNDFKIPSHDFRKKIRHITQDKTQIFSVLSKREKQVAEQSLLGLPEKDIASQLGIGLGSVITYRKRLYSKLNISSKTELFQLALMQDS